ncbi:MAG: hypothetical protein FWG66_08850 [Spirochaetes bacterium]|nr:hypothetical protein [Spirochaetota bacterium]
MTDESKMAAFAKLYEKYHAGDGRKESPESRQAKYLSREEYIADAEADFSKYIEGEKPAKQILLLLRFINDPYMLGLYEAFSKRDMRHLLNVLHQSARYAAASRGVLGSGVDHCVNFSKAVKAFAANDAALANALLPKELGASKNGHKFSVTCTNLMMGIWHKDERALEKAKAAGRKFLSGKRTLLETAATEYLIALAENDIAKAGASLKDICAGQRKSKEWGETKLTKCFCIEAHGLYSFAHFALPGADFSRLEPPQDDGFIKAFAQWNVENAFPQGSLFLAMPGKLNLMDAILTADLPAQTLCKPYEGKNTLCTDAKAFEKELVERVLASRP